VLSGAEVAYLPTDRELGVIIEIFSDMRDTDQEPDATNSPRDPAA
jgi:hypothetical protein